jgi:branched-chain amino acid transport system ATP-binding protein
LSGGQARSLAIAMGLVRQPKWLLLDEPTIGLSPQRIDRIFGFLKTLQTTDHIGVIIAEQNVLAAVSSFDEAIVLRSGRVSWRGSCSTLRELASVDLAKLL